ncbi:hypothetical protein B0H14DRAFT_3473343 [Mycena olivaceomarginata]|nr:hypothetical protein B0H14DRAFT_3473343 [Mycena olivaceomarginata]
MSYFRPCLPPFRPSPGDENTERLSSTANRVFYVVGVGYTRGIYTNDVIARDQVNDFSDGKWKKASTYEAATEIWNKMFHRLLPRQWPAHLCRHAHRLVLPHIDPPHLVPPHLVPPHLIPPQPAALLLLFDRPPVHRQLVALCCHRSRPPLFASPKQTSGSNRSHWMIAIVESTRHPSSWRAGETLWGIQGTHLLFEDRYDAVDHIYVKRLSPAHLMESRNRQELEAFVRMLPYEGQDGAES